jgi:YVTN family beta-propeller protein
LKNKVLAVVLALLVVVGLSAGYLAGTSNRQTVTTTSTATALSTSTTLSVTTLTATATATITTTLIETLVSPSGGINTTLRFVGAEVIGSGGFGVVVNATYRNNSPSALTVIVNGTAYPAQASYFPVTGGSPIGPVCCAIVRSFSANGSTPASAKVGMSPWGEVSSDLFFPDLNASVYWVKVVATTLNDTVLSPVAYLLLETSTALGNSSGMVCGGQEAPGSIFYDRDNGEIYIADSGTDSVSVLNGTNGRLAATISLPELVGNIGFQLYDPGNGDLYVDSQGSNEVFVIDTSTNLFVGEMTVSQPGQFLQGMVYDPLNGKIFGINFVYSLISVVDGSTNKIVANITGINGPFFATYDPGNNELYVQAYNQTVFAINGDTDKVVATIPIPYQYNTQFLYDQDNGLLYTISGDTVLMINSSTSRLSNSTITLPQPSTGAYSYYTPILYNPSNKDLYVYGFDGFPLGSNASIPDELRAIDTQNESVVATIPVQGVGGGLFTETPSFFYDSSTEDLYATTILNSSAGATGLLEISRTNAVVSQVTLAGVAFGSDMAFDSSSHMLFVSGPPLGGTPTSSVVMVNPSLGNVIQTITLGTCPFVTPLP